MESDDFEEVKHKTFLQSLFGGILGKSKGLRVIMEERWRQVKVHCWSDKRDDTYVNDELAYAAACYALPRESRIKLLNQGNETIYLREMLWPWAEQWWKPDESNKGSVDGRIEELAKAGALIAAELDRLLRIVDKEEVQGLTSLSKINGYKPNMISLKELPKEESESILNKVISVVRKYGNSEVCEHKLIELFKEESQQLLS